MQLEKLYIRVTIVYNSYIQTSILYTVLLK